LKSAEFQVQKLSTVIKPINPYIDRAGAGPYAIASAEVQSYQSLSLRIPVEYSFNLSENEGA